MKAKNKTETESEPGVYADEKFHRKVFGVLADLQLRDGVPLHPPTMRRELRYKLGLRKAQSRYFINRLVNFGWVVPDRGRGLFMNEAMLEEFEDKRRLEEQRSQASASMWDGVNKDVTYWLNENWYRHDQQKGDV